MYNIDDMISELRGIIAKENSSVPKIAESIGLNPRSIAQKFRSRTLRSDEFFSILKELGYTVDIKKKDS